MSLYLLDGEFAYAEPLRLALQQLSWGKPSPLDAPEERSVALAVTADSGGRELSQRLSKVETAIFRRKTILFDYYTIGRDAEEKRKVDPYHLLFRGGQFYLIGHSHERDDVRVFRVSRIRGKVGYSSKAEHDFNRPEDFDPRTYATRTDWQLGDPVGRARIWLSDRIDWLALRHFGHAGEVTEDEGGACLRHGVRGLAPGPLVGARAGRPGAHPRAGRAGRGARRAARDRDRAPHGNAGARAPRRAGAGRSSEEDDGEDRGESPIRPERFARLVTLAGMLIDAAREAHKIEVAELCERLQISEQELRQDIDVLNVVNFGGGSYVLYAEIQGGPDRGRPRALRRQLRAPGPAPPARGEGARGRDRPDRRPPARGLARLRTRPKIVEALGQDPAAEGLQITTAKGDDSEVARVVSGAIAARRLLKVEYYKENEDEFTERTVEPYKLANGQEGWYVHSFDLERDAPRSYRLDRIRQATVLDDTFEPRDGSGARRARLALHRRGAVIEHGAHLDLTRARALGARGPPRRGGALRRRRGGRAHLRRRMTGSSREILKEAGDAVVLEPEDARTAVLEAAEALAGAVKR